MRLAALLLAFVTWRAYPLADLSRMAPGDTAWIVCYPDCRWRLMTVDRDSLIRFIPGTAGARDPLCLERMRLVERRTKRQPR